MANRNTGPAPSTINPILYEGPVQPPEGPIPRVTLNFLGSGSVISAPSATTLNTAGRTAQQRQQQVAAENALLRVLYGRVAIGAQIADVLFYNGNLVITAVWGHGSINAVEQIFFDDNVAPAGVTITNYTGTQVAADRTLVAAYAAQVPAIVYADVLPKIAYSVIVLPPGVTTGFPRINAIVQGLKVFDPRTGTTIYSDNPALALADLETNTIYGGAGSVDWATVTTVANACDGLVGGTEKRRTIGLAIDQAQALDSWREVLRAYAGCFCARGAAGALVLIADRPATSSFSFSESTESGLEVGWTVIGTGVSDEALAHRIIFNAGGLYNVVVGDLFEYEVWLDPTSPAADAAGYSGGGAYPEFTNNSTLAGSGDSQTGATAAGQGIDSAIRGKWYHRTIGMTGQAGLAVRSVFLAQNGNNPGAYRVLYRNIKITNAGALKLAIYAVTGQPLDNTVSLQTANISNPRIGPAGICRVKNMKRRSKRDVPTLCGVRYTDTSRWPWRDNIAYAYLAGVLAGTVPWKPREVSMPGITRNSQALREALEQLNKLQLNDLTFDVEAADEALSVTVGDVVTATANVGINAQMVRVVGARLPSLGRPMFSVEKYDPAAYSDSVVTGPSIVDTLLPNPNSLSPPVAPLNIVETVYLERVNGSSLAAGMVYQSRFDCSWTAPPLQYPIGYRVEVWDGTTKIRDEQCQATNYATPAVQQGKTYTIKVFARNSLVECPTPLVASQTALGKQLPPGPVPSITRAVELGGRVLLSWTPAPDIDVMRYEWRYTPNTTGGGSWAGATLIDRVDGLSTTFQGLPVGTHRFYVRAIDSVGNYSTGDCTADIAVTSDANAFTQARAFTSPTLTNMAAAPVVEGIGALRWITSVAGDQWSTVEPSPLNSGGNAVASYHTNATQRFQGESWDLGTTLSGAWSLAATVTSISGAPAYYIETSPDGSTWTRQPGIAWQGTTRFIRPVIEALTTATMRIESPPTISLAALTRTESGLVTTSASVATLVQLTGRYAAAADLQVTPANATAARDAVWDRLLIHPEQGLMLTYTGTGNGTTNDAFLTHSILNSGGAGIYTVVAGDVFEYEVYIDSSSPGPDAGSLSCGGGYLQYTDNSTNAGGGDAQSGASMIGAGMDSSARGKWYYRSISLTPDIGKAVNFVNIVQAGDLPGNYKVLYRNMRIKNGVTTKLDAYFRTTGDPTNSTLVNSGFVSNVRLGSANAFNVYAFNPTTGAQVANDVRWAFRGY
jgi:hypothetical protein